MELEKTITLRKPAKVGDVEYTTISLREPMAGELAKAASAKNNVDAVIVLISLIAKIPPPAAESICQRDLNEADAFFGQFSA